MTLSPFIIHHHTIICDSCDHITTYDEVYHQHINGRGLVCNATTKLPTGECRLLTVSTRHIPCCSECFDAIPISEQINRESWAKALLKSKARQIKTPEPKTEDLDSVL